MVTDEENTDETSCPVCGGETSFGYGLAGGGIGAYRFCLTEDCEYFEKEQDSSEDNVSE